MIKLGKNALVIQQHNDCLDVLESVDCKVITAEDCLDGIRKVIRYRPDFIITKVDTKNLSAISMARVLNLLKVDTPILLTGPKNEYEKEIKELPNLKRFLQDSAIYFDLKKTLTDHLEIFHKRPIEKQRYSFTEHEWSNLISKRGPKRILLVEYDTLTRKAQLIKLDNHTDHQLFAATNGLDAILKALLIKPDIILTAVDLPVINGLTMSQIFYILNKPIPIVFLTANDDPTFKERVMKVEGVIGYIYKGDVSQRGELVSAVNRYLGMAEEVQGKLAENYMLASPTLNMDEDLIF